MYIERGRGEFRTEIWWGQLSKSESLEEIDVEGRIIFR